MRRTRTGKHLEITPRDIEIFRVLASYRYLRSTYLHAFAGGASETRFKERLGDLYHEGFIDRPEKQWEFASARYLPIVYEIGEGAKRARREHGLVGSGPRTYLSATAHRQFAHSVMICEALASIELATLASANIRFISWSELLAKAPESSRASPVPFRIPLADNALIPDGVFGLEYRSEDKKTYRFFALEIDRGTMPISRSDETKTSYLGKLVGYQRVIAQQTYRSHWGIPNLFVLTITTGPERLSAMVRELGERSASAALFLFKAAPTSEFSTPAPGLLSEPWVRASLPAIYIDHWHADSFGAHKIAAPQLGSPGAYLSASARSRIARNFSG